MQTENITEKIFSYIGTSDLPYSSAASPFRPSLFLILTCLSYVTSNFGGRIPSAVLSIETILEHDTYKSHALPLSLSFSLYHIYMYILSNKYYIIRIQNSQKVQERETDGNKPYGASQKVHPPV